MKKANIHIKTDPKTKGKSPDTKNTINFFHLNPLNKTLESLFSDSEISFNPYNHILGNQVG